MRVSICLPSELDNTLVNRWREIQSSNPAFDNPFLSPEFTKAVGEVSPQARVAVVEQNCKIVGFLPFESYALKIAKAIGLGVSDLQGMVIESETEIQMSDVLAKLHISVYEFDHLLPAQLGGPGIVARFHDSPYMDLSQGYNSYMSQGLRNERRLVKSTLQKQRKFVREHGEPEFVFDANCPNTLSKLMHLKSQQYLRTGRTDRFSRIWIRQLLEILNSYKTETFSGVLSASFIDGKPISMHFGIRTAKTLSLWFPTFDPEYSKYSPGMQMFFDLARAAESQGLQNLDLGRGEEEFKQSLKSGDKVVASGSIGSRSIVCHARRLQHAPKEKIEEYVLSHPSLRRGARNLLRQVGTLRVSSLRRSSRLRRSSDWKDS